MALLDEFLPVKDSLYFISQVKERIGRHPLTAKGWRGDGFGSCKDEQGWLLINGNEGRAGPA